MAVAAVVGQSALGDMFRFLSERGWYPNIVSIGFFSFREPLAALIFVYAAAPSVAALVTVFWADGRAGVGRLLGRFKPWGRGVPYAQAVKAYGAMFAVYLAVAGAYLWAAAPVRAGRGVRPVDRAPRRLADARAGVPPSRRRDR